MLFLSALRSLALIQKTPPLMKLLRICTSSLSNKTISELKVTTVSVFSVLAPLSSCLTDEEETCLSKFNQLVEVGTMSGTGL